MLTTPKWKMTQLPICLCLKVTIFIDSEMLYFFILPFVLIQNQIMMIICLYYRCRLLLVQVLLLSLLRAGIQLSCNMQPTLQTFLNRTKKIEINNPKAQAIHNAITRMICTESLPFNFVESDGFKHLINKLCAKYQIPNRKYFSDKVVPK
jgi:hypothetical protein